MKKFRVLMAGLTIVYIAFAIIMVVVTVNSNRQATNMYRVEIERISYQVRQNAMINNAKSIMHLDVADFKDREHIKAIAYLPISVKDSDEISKFYISNNQYQMEIVPLMTEDRITGYLRFDYIKNIDIRRYLIIAQIFMGLIYLFFMVAYLYIDRCILKPFNRLSTMPYELAKGNLNEAVHESKSRFFGKFVWGINMLRDTLEEHKRKEMKLARDKKMILLSISHDIKTPLNAISLYAQALEQGMYETPEQQKETAVSIQEKTKEIDDFVKQIMKSSTEDVISIEVNKSEFYLKDLIYKIQNGYAEKCSIHQIQFVIGTFDNHLITGDLERLYEAFGNLIENAIKYGDGKKITVDFSEEDYCELIHIYNSGTPVADSEILHLFDSFYRGTNTDGKPGNGLGLYICKEIMLKMDGDIYVVARENGMEFVLVCRMA
jgi:signal transduction histidine kinase